MDYFKYLLSPILLLTYAYGIWLGENWVWLGLGCLLFILFLDVFLKPDFSMRNQKHVIVYDVIVTMTVLLSFANVFFYTWLVGHNHFETISASVGAFLGMVFIGFVVHAPPVHELFHRENYLLKYLGRIGQCLIFDPWREITHVVTHHMKVATPDDPDYARRGESVYHHLYKTFPLQFKEAYHLEKLMWTKRDRKWYNLKNSWVHKLSYLVIFVGILICLGGLKGTLLAIFSILMGPRMLLEVFNYCNHYGLISATPGRFEKRHTWNHLTPFVRILALEITNHAGHHEDSYKPFYKLEPDKNGPQQPQFLMCVILAFIPPLFFKMIKPLLFDWDIKYATQQEKEIAYRENQRAGWV